ncbi:DUF1549 domain-containing protein [uncultured Polaribacter sp.]|uniref:DUF1549 domain-containing protein n=1 Tax=uncultured Polaribacter sp. TaxID=174711 RepID=UPI0026200721|nr:DUF1549 domain-containing protein [uncultured Polaribacter sp.]
MDTSNWILQFLGRLHPLLVHFPIGLLVVALLLEFLTIVGKRKGLREGINWMVYIGAGFAIFSALFGWFLKTQDDYSGDLVDNHQYTGIATAILGLVTAIVLKNSIKKAKLNLKAYRFMLFATVGLLTIAGHLGANLTHGEDYLTAILPGNKEVYSNKESGALLSELKGASELSELQKDKLSLEVRGLFAHKCYQCHSENKQKGELILEHKEGVFKGGKSGLAVVAGKPEESEIYKRIILPADNKKVMPTKGKLLTADEIALVKLWITEGAHWSDQAVKIFPEAPLKLVKPELPKVTEQTHPIDKIISTYFDKNSVAWQSLVEDRKFIKRAYLDVVGLLPAPEAITTFVNDSNPKKRELLIDELLNDSENYTQHWLSFWNDLLRNDYSGTGFITKGRFQITNWLYNSLKNNKSYDQMISQLMNPDKSSEGFIKGIKWRGVVNSSQSTEMQAAQNIGQSLMGVNVKCASCHNSFVSNLTLDQAYGFASIFADEPLELNRCDKPIGKIAKVNFLYPELGSVAGKTLKERLLKLSEVMINKENGRLYRTITNRVWERLIGRGIIEPVDEMDNTPWNAELLDWIAADFIDSGTDLKHLIKRIMTSKAYQMPTVNYKKQEDLKKDYVFKGPVLRRLSAEQFSDAISQVVAPVYQAVAFNPNEEKMPAQRIWHHEKDLTNTVLPLPGKRYFRKVFQLSKKTIKNASVLISVDDAYTLFINGKRVGEGNDWTKVGKYDVTHLLHKGDNIIAVEGNNIGKIDNPASILFAMKVVFTDGKSFKLYSNETWKSTDRTPNKNWVNLNFDTKNWKKVKNYGNSNWAKLLDFTFKEHEKTFARASLVKQHSFLKALGRPNREIVVSKREEQATLLQALELTNGAYFNGVLEKGAEKWLEKYGTDSGVIVDTLYQKLLGRHPSSDEQKILIASLGNQPNTEQLQDVIWSVLISPEFQFIN